MNVFEWSGLPPTCDEYVIERSLFENGQFCMHRDKSTGNLYSLPCWPTNRFNIYGYPNVVSCYGFATGYQKDVNVNKWTGTPQGAWGRNNILTIPTRNLIGQTIDRMYNVMRAQDINVNTLKTPYVFAGDKKEVEQFKQIYKVVEDNHPAVVTLKNLINGVEILNTGAKSYLSELEDHLVNLENRLLTTIGVDNSPIDRKERVSNLEVQSNNEKVELSGDSFLRHREQFCEDANKLFGTNISVKYRIKREVQSIGSTYGYSERTST